MSQTREQWLAAAGTILAAELVAPHTDSAPLIRYSMTAPKIEKKTVVGECWNRAASTDGANEIFITASLGESDSMLILATLVHEIVHAFDDNENGHKGRFIELCKLAGLEGGPNGRVKHSFTATVAGAELTKRLEALIKELGDIPHAAMDARQSGKKRQTNRQLLVACNMCDFKFRASQKTIDSIEYFECLSCPSGTLVPANGE